MEEAVESTGRQGSYIDKTRNYQAPLLPPTTPLLPVRATRAPFQVQNRPNHASPFNYAGRRGRGNVNGSNQTAAPFQFPFIVLLHG
jgi:hypothetical protein